MVRDKGEGLDPFFVFLFLVKTLWYKYKTDEKVTLLKSF